MCWWHKAVDLLRHLLQSCFPLVKYFWQLFVNRFWLLSSLMLSCYNNLFLSNILSQRKWLSFNNVLLVCVVFRDSSGIWWNYTAWCKTPLCFCRSNCAKNHYYHEEGEVRLHFIATHYWVCVEEIGLPLGSADLIGVFALKLCHFWFV